MGYLRRQAIVAALTANALRPARGPRTGIPSFAAGWLFVRATPVLLGFLVPGGYLAVEAWKRFHFAGLSESLFTEARNTFLLSAIATMAVLASGLAVAYAARAFPRRGLLIAQRVATLGYAMPGTVLALGILIWVAGLDRFIDQSAREFLGRSTGLLLIGPPPQLGPGVLPGNNYHVYDIPLFWSALRADVGRRVRAFGAGR